MAQAVALMTVAPWSSATDVALHLVIEGTALLSGPLVLILAWVVRRRHRASGASSLLAASAPLVWTSLALAIQVDAQIPLRDTLAGRLVLQSTWLGWAAPWIGLTAALRLSSVYPQDLARHFVAVVGRPASLIDQVRSLAFDLRRLLTVGFLVPVVTGVVAVAVIRAGEAFELTTGEDVVFALVVFSLLTWMLLGVVATIRNFALGLKVSGRGDQRRALWSVAGMVAAGTTVLLSAALWILDLVDVMPEFPNEWLLDPVLVAPLLIVLGLYLAIFYEGFLDPRLVIRRSTIAGVLAVVVVALFALVDEAFSRALAAVAPAAGGVGSWVAVAVTALAVAPLHDRVRRRADSWMATIAPAAPEGEADRSSEGNPDVSVARVPDL